MFHWLFAVQLPVGPSVTDTIVGHGVSQEFHVVSAEEKAIRMRDFILALELLWGHDIPLLAFAYAADLTTTGVVLDKCF